MTRGNNNELNSILHFKTFRAQSNINKSQERHQPSRLSILTCHHLGEYKCLRTKERKREAMQKIYEKKKKGK